MTSLAPSLLPSDDAHGRCHGAGSRHANDASVSHLKKSSAGSLRLVQLLNRQSASSDAPSAARQSFRAHSNKALCDAVGNSAWFSRDCTCLRARADVVNQRSSQGAKLRTVVSKNLNRRRKRRLGRLRSEE